MNITTRATIVSNVQLDDNIRIWLLEDIWHWSLALRTFFTARMHLMQRTVLRRPFCPSVCLSVSVKRVHCDKTKEICARIPIPHESSFVLVFWQEEWLVGLDVISPNLIALQADYVTVVEYIPIVSAKYRLPVTFGQNWRKQQLHGLFATAKLFVRISG